MSSAASQCLIQYAVRVKMYDCTASMIERLTNPRPNYVRALRAGSSAVSKP